MKPLTSLRKRPRQDRASATFSAILEAAARILQDDARFTTNTVADRAGVSVGSLYQYFPNKAAIVRALMEREVAAALEVRPRLLDDPAQPLEQRVRALVDWRFDVRLKDEVLSSRLNALASDVLSPQELTAFDGYRRLKTVQVVSTWLASRQSHRADVVAFLIDTVLVNIADRAADDALHRLRDTGFRKEVTALITRFVAEPP
jgi:AcrR family transcriptional regulator